MPHRTRPAHSFRHPLHVTVRVVRGLESLRHRRLRKPIFAAIAAGADKFGFRVVHFSVQSNHLHLICEASDRRALGRGMKGLGVRVARAVNRRLGRQGALVADRYHAEQLRTPRQVRNALVYVLNNARKHGVPLPPRFVDPCSTAALFDGWADAVRAEPASRALLFDARGAPIATAPQNWILATGWRRRGLLDADTVPRGAGPAASHAARDCRFTGSRRRSR